LNEGIGYDQEEGFAFRKFNDVEHKVPLSLLNEVKDDNMKFLFDRQVYSIEFFEFLNSLFIELCETLGSLEEMHVNVLTIIGIKSIFTILSRSSYNPILNSLTDNFVNVMKESKVVLRELLNYLIKNFDTEVMPILLQCPYKPIRQAIETLISNTLLISFNKNEGEEYKKGIEVVDILVDKVNNKLAKDCARFEQFFKIFEKIIKESNDSVREYLNSKDFIKILLDFYLEDESPFYDKHKPRDKMQTKNLKPLFDPLIESACTLAIHSDLSFKQPLDVTIRSLLNLPNPSYKLSVDSITILTSVSFLSRTLIHSTPTFAKLITFFCYNNEKYSKSVVKIILKGINANLLQHFNKYILIIDNILQLSDSLQQERFEWILGVASMSHDIRQSQVKLKSFEYIKIALMLVNDIKEKLFDYLSPLSYKSLYNSLLGLLLIEREHLYLLVNMMLNNKTLLHYIVLLPPPTYQYSSFFDFIKFHIEHNKDVIENLNKAQLEDRKELVVKPYMVGKIVGENFIIKKKKDNVLVIASELITECFNSLPNGNCNQAIPSNYFKVPENERRGITVTSIEPSILKIEVCNCIFCWLLIVTAETIKVKVKIRAEAGVNFYCPTSTLTNIVKPNRRIIIYMCQKFTLGKPWGNFTMDWTVKGQMIKEVNIRNFILKE